MNRIKFQNIIDRTENCIWSKHLCFWKIKHQKLSAELKKNSTLFMKHQGETCFILGNGPSLKSEPRVNELENYTVFTVNQFYRSDLFGVVKPQYHVMIDPIFFKLNPNIESDYDTLSRMKNVSDNTSVNMILSVDYYDYIAKYLGNIENHYFVKNRYKMCDDYNRKIDMTEYLPATYNVVQTAIYCAIYMGFSRIVLLGCDMTGLLDNYIRYSKNEDIEKFSHVYEYTQAEKERMKKVHFEHSNEFMLYGFYNMFHDFRNIMDLCKKNHIQLLNATNNTALDMIPHIALNDFLDKEQKK